MYVLSHRALLALLCWSDANFDGQIQQCDYFVGAFSSSIIFLIKFIILKPLTVCDKKRFYVEVGKKQTCISWSGLFNICAIIKLHKPIKLSLYAVIQF